jgi:hypothetical protein
VRGDSIGGMALKGGCNSGAEAMRLLCPMRNDRGQKVGFAAGMEGRVGFTNATIKKLGRFNRVCDCFHNRGGLTPCGI